MPKTLTNFPIPAIGQETAKLILDIIEATPESFDMSTWEAHNPELKCGTTRCVAGWAQFIHEGRVEFDSGGDDNVEVRGARYLGINTRDADGLFYGGEERAKLALGYLARGEAINWDEVRATLDARAKVNA